MRSAPGALRASAARAGMQALCRLARSRPVVVLLDDAHWTDDVVLEALEQATACEIPLWVGAFGRPAFARSRPTWGERASGVEQLRLGPLDRGSARALCRRLLEPARQVPEPVLDRLVDRTEGSPRLIGDLLRELRREGLVRRDAAGVWVVASDLLDRVSDSPLLEWLASRELDDLPPELAAHARLLALLPSAHTLEEVEGVLAAMASGGHDELADAFPLDARVGNARLQRAGLLAQSPEGRFTFRNELLRGSIARTVGEGLALRIHRAALAHHRAIPPQAVGRLSRLAWHAAAAGDGEEAATAYLALAEAARERHRYLEAELLYGRCLDQLDEQEEPARLRAFRGRGIMRYRLGRHDDSVSDLAQAHALAVRRQDPLLQADLLLDEAMALDWLIRWPRSRELAERARALFPGGAPPELEARILLAEGRSLHRFNRDAEATRPLREAEALARSIGDAAYEVRVTANLVLGLVLPLLGLTGEAEERLDDVQLLCEEAGDELHLIALCNNRSCLWIALDDRQRFMEENARARAAGRRLGNATVERYANLNGAGYLYWRNELEAALPFVRRMIEIDQHSFRQGGFRPDGSLLLARIQWARGAEAEAHAIVEEIHRHQAAARAAGQSELLLPPNDELLLAVTTRLLDDSGPDHWPALVERAREVAPGQELIEVLELAGLAAQRRGDSGQRPPLVARSPRGGPADPQRHGPPDPHPAGRAHVGSVRGWRPRGARPDLTPTLSRGRERANGRWGGRGRGRGGRGWRGWVLGLRRWVEISRTSRTASGIVRAPGGGWRRWRCWRSPPSWGRCRWRRWPTPMSRSPWASGCAPSSCHRTGRSIAGRRRWRPRRPSLRRWPCRPPASSRRPPSSRRCVTGCPTSGCDGIACAAAAAAGALDPTDRQPRSARPSRAA